MIETIGTISKIAELKRELAELIEAKSKLLRLSLEDHEDVTENYQMHIELGYEIDGLRYEIRNLERQLG